MISKAFKAQKPKPGFTRGGGSTRLVALSLYLVAVTIGAALGAYSTWPMPEVAKLSLSELEPPPAQTTPPTPEQLVAQARAALDAAAKRNAESIREEQDRERALVRFVLYLGILGACLHAMTSVATYAGNRTFEKSWTTWYVLRPFIGGTLAWLVFLVFRGGFLGGADVDALNPYAFGALAALSGLFSKSVIDKLSELIETLFRMVRGQGDDLRKDKAAAGTPSIKAVQPPQLSESQEMTTVIVTGSGFGVDTFVEVDGTPFKPTAIRNSELTVEIPVEAYIGRSAVNLVVADRDAQVGAISLKVVP